MHGTATQEQQMSSYQGKGAPMPTELARALNRFVTLACAIVLILVGCAGASSEPDTTATTTSTPNTAAAPDKDAPKLSNEQLDALVAPVALYPDKLLAQVLVAATYPLELKQLAQWLPQHKD